MNEARLIYSKFPRKESYYYSFDVVLYNMQYYSGLNLYKNFNNYLAGSPHLSVMTFTDENDALNYFNTFEF